MAESAPLTAADLDALATRLAEVESYLHLEEKRGRVEDLERQSAAPGFWDDADAARALMAELARDRDDIKAV